MQRAPPRLFSFSNPAFPSALSEMLRGFDLFLLSSLGLFVDNELFFLLPLALLESLPSPLAGREDRSCARPLFFEFGGFTIWLGSFFDRSVSLSNVFGDLGGRTDGASSFSLSLFIDCLIGAGRQQSSPFFSDHCAFLFLSSPRLRVRCRWRRSCIYVSPPPFFAELVRARETSSFLFFCKRFFFPFLLYRRRGEGRRRDFPLFLSLLNEEIGELESIPPFPPPPP